MTERLSILLFALIQVFYTLFVQVDSRHGKCCRSLAETVWFEPYPHHSEGGVGAVVTRVSMESGKTVVVVRNPATPMDSASEEHRYRFWRSDNYGQNWREASEAGYSPIVVRGAVLLRAPSNSNLLYRYQSDTGTYLRSANAGRTWTRPRFLLEGKESGEVVRTFCSAPELFNTWFRVVAIHPSRPNTLYASVTIATWVPTKTVEGHCTSNDLGLYVSHDSGENWQKLSEALRADEPIGITPSSPEILYGHMRKGVGKSLDGGKSWRLVKEHERLEMRPLTLADSDEQVRVLKGLYGLQVLQIVIDPRNSSVVYLVCNKGILKSSNGGETWCLLDWGHDQVGAVNSLVLSPENSEEMFVGTGFGVFFSNDGGCSFRRIWSKAFN